MYLHTTHETWATDPGGGLTRQTFELGVAAGFNPTAKEIDAGAEAIGRRPPLTSTSNLNSPSAGSEWRPDEELRATLPARPLGLLEGC